MKRRMAQPLIVLPIAVTLMLTLSVVVLSAQPSPIVDAIGFEIEGNTALDQGGDYDWENAIPPGGRIPDPNSKIETDPTTFKPNSKFEDPAGWSIMPGKVGPGQSELVNLLYWDIQPGALGEGRPDDHWLVLGMERIKEPGFFELDFEYNQAAWDGSSGGLVRTPGDVLVGFELRGKPTSKRAEHKVLLLQYLPGAQPSLCSTTSGPGGEPELVEVGADPCPPYGGSGWYYRLLADEALSAESGLVQATMIGPYHFAEAAINLTALGIEPECSAPGSVHAKSRSAPHPHSDLKDLVGPVGLTCELGRLDGHKFKDINGNGEWDKHEPPLEGWKIELSDGSVTYTDQGGYYAFEDLAYGTYKVSEVCPPGEDWVQTAPIPDDLDTCGEAVYTVQLDSGTPEVNDLDFGNHWPEIRLDGHKFKDINGNGVWEVGEPPLKGWKIELSDGSVAYTDAEGYYAFEDLAYGSYTVSEVCPDGWAQTAPGSTDFDTCGSEVHTVELDSGCPEKNDLDFGNGKPALSLEKECNAVSAGIAYTITVTNTGNVFLQDIHVEDPQVELDKLVDLAPGNSETFEVLLAEGVGPNMATATAQYAEATITASDTADCEPTDVVLDVSKDAQTSFTRTYQWTLEKTVDNPGPIQLYPGDWAEVEYQVVAGLDDQEPYVDSAWAVEGTVVIANPLGEDALLESVTDVISPGNIAVPVDCEDVSVPALGSITCTYGPVLLPDGLARTNTVTVTVGSTEEFTATAPIVFDQPTTEIDEEARVADTNWADAQWEGPEWFDIGHGDTPWVEPYVWKIWAPEAECGLFDVPNTATLVTNDTNTVLTDDANVQILEICLTLAYEDLPLILGNDWDYNDLVIEIPINLDVSDDGDLLSASFEIWQTERQTAFTHAFNLQPCAEYFTCSGIYTKTVTLGGDVTTETGVYESGDNFLLIPDTGMPWDLVELTIEFDVPEPGACPRYCGEPDPINQYHGEWLFFDPWLTVYPRPDLGWDPYEIHVIREGDPEPRILTVPIAWTPPSEKVPIWCVYSGVTEGEDGQPVFTDYWWDTPPPEVKPPGCP